MRSDSKPKHSYTSHTASARAFLVSSRILFSRACAFSLAPEESAPVRQSWLASRTQDDCHCAGFHRRTTKITLLPYCMSHTTLMWFAPPNDAWFNPSCPHCWEHLPNLSCAATQIRNPASRDIPTTRPRIRSPISSQKQSIDNSVMFATLRPRWINLSSSNGQASAMFR
jgi:hypothetical protein